MASANVRAAARRLALTGVLLLRAISANAQSFGLDGAGHDRGSQRDAVEIAEFMDFGCSQCARFATETMVALDSEFVRTGRARWKAIPFVLGVFRNSAQAAEAAECAAEQGAFWPMHDRLFAEQQAWSAKRRPDELFIGWAAALGADTVKFRACLSSGAARDRVKRNGELARWAGVLGTPTFVIGRKRIVVGAYPYARFRAIVLEELAKDARVPARPTAP